MIHNTVDTIKNLLEQNNMWYEYMEHEPVRTSEEAAKIREGSYTLSQGTKALIVRVKKNSKNKFFAMLVIPGDLRFDIKKVKNVVDAKDVRFATEKEVIKITKGVLPGGVPPFGNLFDLKTYLDGKVLEHEKIIFNAGDKKVSIAMKSDDYLKLVSPTRVDIT